LLSKLNDKNINGTFLKKSITIEYELNNLNDWIIIYFLDIPLTSPVYEDDEGKTFWSICLKFYFQVISILLKKVFII